jgi:hypothetical protein
VGLPLLDLVEQVERARVRGDLGDALALLRDHLGAARLARGRIAGRVRRRRRRGRRAALGGLDDRGADRDRDLGRRLAGGVQAAHLLGVVGEEGEQLLEGHGLVLGWIGWWKRSA